jgi:hypothetical protein
MIEFFEVAMVKSLPNDLIPSPHTPKETHTHAHGRTRSDPTVTMTVHSPLDVSRANLSVLLCWDECTRPAGYRRKNLLATSLTATHKPFVGRRWTTWRIQAWPASDAPAAAISVYLLSTGAALSFVFALRAHDCS